MIKITAKNEKKSFIIYGLLLMIMCLSLLCFYFFMVRPASFEEVSYQPNYPQEASAKEMKLQKGQTWVQTIRGSRNEITSFDIMFGAGKSANVSVDFHEKKSGQLLGSWKLEVPEAEESHYQHFAFETPVDNAMGKEYEIKIQTEETSEPTVSLPYTEKDFYGNGSLTAGGEKLDGDLFFLLNATSGFMRKLFMGFAAWVILGGAVLAFLVIRRKCRTENLFLVLGLTWGMFFVIFFPPNTAPDENAHIATAYSNADRIMGREAEDEQGKVSVRASDLNIPVMTDVSRKTFNMVYEKWQEPVNDQAVSYIRGRLGTPIVAHLPQTIGVVLGWLTGQGAVQTLYLGKFMGLLFYIFCVYWAIRFIPWGKMSLMLIALFPMSLELAGSFSYDCLVNALCFLFIGYTMHLIYKKEIVTWKDILFLAAIAGIMAPCKIAYIFVCGICFLIPKKKFRKKQYFIGCGMIMASGVVFLIIERMSFLYNSLVATGESAGAVEGAVGFSLHDIISQPINSLKMVFNTYFEQGEYYLGTIVGQSLGWFQVNISWVVIAGLLLLLFMTTFSSAQESECMTAKERIVVIMLSLIMIGGTVMGMWLNFTPDFCTYIAGVQGRYFLPFLPLLVLAVKNKTIYIRKKMDYGLAAAVFALEFMAALDVWRYIIK